MGRELYVFFLVLAFLVMMAFLFLLFSVAYYFLSTHYSRKRLDDGLREAAERYKEEKEAV